MARGVLGADLPRRNHPANTIDREEAGTRRHTLSVCPSVSVICGPPWDKATELPLPCPSRADLGCSPPHMSKDGATNRKTPLVATIRTGRGWTGPFPVHVAPTRGQKFSVLGGLDSCLSGVRDVLRTLALENLLCFVYLGAVFSVDGDEHVAVQDLPLVLLGLVLGDP